MNSARKAAIVIGVLFIVTTFTFSIGDGIIQEITNLQDYPASVSQNTTPFVIAVLLQLICGLGVVGIAVVIYPIFKKYNEKIAVWYVSIRAMECAIIAVSGINLLSFLSFGRNYIETETAMTNHFQILGDSLVAEYHAAFIMLALVLSFGAFAFYYLLFKSRLIPRFISVWGIIGIVLMVTGLLIDALGYGPKIMLYIPMGANELFLGLWLIVRGFNSSAILSE